MTAPDSLSFYPGLDEHLGPLDARKTSYQFDLEADVPWDRLSEPGLYVSPDMLADLGVDAAALQAHPEAWELFQWSYALLTCEGFIIAEKQIIDFFADEPPLLQRQSNVLLRDEELKHIAMFRRYADHLRDQRPEWSFAFDRVFVESGCDPTGTEVRRVLSPFASHLMFWCHVVFFEEVTLYIHKRLSARAEIQPAWRAVHECHMREEAQHLRTDMAHVAALGASDQERLEAAEMMRVAILDEFDRCFALRVAVPLVRETFPDLALADAMPPEQTRVFADIVGDHPMFRRSRTLLAGRVDVPGERRDA